MDVSRYKALFLTEAGEQAKALEAALLSIERAGPEQGAVERAFRHAHSLKGMSGAMGYGELQGLAHAMEDLLEELRHLGEGDKTPRDATEALLAAVDAMGLLLTGISSDRASNVDVDALGARLRGVLGGSGNGAGEPIGAVTIVSARAPLRVASTATRGAVSTATMASARTALLPGQRLVEVHVDVSPRCSSQSVRAFIVFRRLSTLGEVVSVSPALESIRGGDFRGALELRLRTLLSAAEIEKVLESIPDLAGYVVQERSGAAAGEVMTFRSGILGDDPSRGVSPDPTGAEASRPDDAKEALPVPSLPVSPRPPVPLHQKMASSTVRVRTELLDRFMDSLTDLLLAKSHLAETASKLGSREMEEGVGLLERAVRAVHDRVMEVRLLAVSNLTERLPRLVRDLAVRRGKRVLLEVSGADVEVDRAVVEALDAPLLHLVRNAVDHGIETPEARLHAGKAPDGKVRITARRERGEVVLEIADDGRGIDPTRLRQSAVERGFLSQERADQLDERDSLALVYIPGLTTATEVSEISGRGVGMDAVKSAVEGLGGHLELASELGVGTRFVLRLPVTVTVINVLAVREAGETYAFATTKVERTVLASADQITPAPEGPRYALGDGSSVPIHRLCELLNFNADAPPRLPMPLLLVATELGQAAIAVDVLLGQREVVLRPLGKLLERIDGLSGITIFGDGRPVFLLDAARLTRGSRA